MLKDDKSMNYSDVDLKFARVVNGKVNYLIDFLRLMKIQQLPKC